MKSWTLTLCMVLSALLSFSQEYCGFDDLRALQPHSHESRAAENDMNHRILDQMNAFRNGQRLGIVTVPVVVHVLHENGEENIPDSQIENAIEQLNAAFSSQDPFVNPEGVDTEIQFCLAGTDPDGEFTTGIVRTETEYAEVFVPSEEQAMKDVSRWDTEKYLNIWLVKELVREPSNYGVIGFATFPDQHGSDLDGVVCEAEFFGTTFDYSKVHMHEIGHYLGLYHTFQDGCPNDDCQTSGDWICDTPPDQQAFSFLCYDGANTCDTDDDDLSLNNPFRPIDLGGLGDVADEKDNFMDYSNLYCMNQFSEEQGLRMKAVVTEIRASLLEGDRCVTPCEAPFEANISVSGTVTNVGDPITFTASGGPFVGVDWYLDDDVISTGDAYIFPADTEGVFEIIGEIYNEDIGCAQEFEFIIQVVCGVSAQFNPGTSSIGTGTELTIVSEGEGITSYKWSIDGTPVGTDPSLTYTFTNEGIVVVTLEVSNGLCIDTYSWNINVGDCISGKESNIWLFNLTDNANFQGMDFSQSGLEIMIAEDNEMASIGHNRSSYCDMAGNLKYATNGNVIYDKNFDLLPNGDINAGTSAHYGTSFIAMPESDNLVYCFHAADQNGFDQGLRYSILDNNLNNALGDVTEVKDVLIETTFSESFSTVRHCNLRDFWLVFYDFQENSFKSYLVNPDGLAETPVVTPMVINIADIYQTFPIEVNGPGDRLMLGNFIFSFDPSSGEVELLHEIVSEFLQCYTFSFGQQYAYFFAGELDAILYQIDLYEDPSVWSTNAQVVYEGGISDLGKGFQVAPDKKIYHEASISSWVGVMENPDVPANEVNYEPNFAFIQENVNGFSNFHHSYVYGPSLFTSGPTEVCLGEEHDYNVFASECLNDIVGWEVIGNVEMVENQNGSMHVDFVEEGEVQLISYVNLFCGIIADTINIQVGTGLPLDLGGDQPICENETLELDAGEGYETYEWQDGSVGQTFTADEAGTYEVTTTIGACTFTESVQVGPEIAASIDLGEDAYLCEGEILLLNAGDDFSDFIWQDGTTGPDFTVFEDGTYYVTATTPCFVTDTLVVTDCDQEIDNVNELNAFGDMLMPNPVTNSLRLVTGTAAEAWTISDSRGRIVAQGTFNGMNQIDINTREYATGVYFLRLEGNDPRVLEFLKID